jgi:OOP family OmpA-OmpF porin
MHVCKASLRLGLLALAIIASPLAAAQDSGWYLGANVGKSKSKIDDERITSGLLGSGFTVTTLDDRNDDTGYKVFLGYAFNRHFAFEGGYFDLGQFGFTAGTTPAGTLTGDLKVKGFNLDMVGTLPFTRKFSAFGRVGLTRADSKAAFSSTGLVVVLNPAPSKQDTNVKYGAGLQYDFTRSVGLRVEVERYRVNDAVGNKGDLDLVSAGLLVRFGRHRAPEPYVAPAPPPEAAAEPAPVVVPVAAETQTYCTILDLQFEINEDVIQREDKERLAVVGTFLTKYPETTAVIEGHTDNVGTDEHNMNLSMRRAESVVAYLVHEIHIAPSRLKAVGYGETRPIADNATEEGKRQNRRIGAVISCAQDLEGLTVMPARVSMALLIEYDPNKSDIKPQYGVELRKVAKFMKANPTVTATVEGHTGNLQGSPELAMEISKLRAEKVVDFLVDSCGVERSRLAAEGFGKGRRYAYNTTAEGQQENRRVNIILNYKK